MGSKNDLRKIYLSKRNNLDEKTAKDLSLQITNHFLNSSLYKKANKIMTYLNYPKEVNTEKIISESLNLGKEVAIPVCDTKNINLIPSKITDLNQVEKGYYGLREPKKEFYLPVENNFDLVIIPGVVFDLYGNRIGHGKGYYDHFLINLDKSTKKIALAYQFQISESELDVEHWDIPMDAIITENGWIYKNL